MRDRLNILEDELQMAHINIQRDAEPHLTKVN